MNKVKQVKYNNQCTIVGQKEWITGGGDVTLEESLTADTTIHHWLLFESLKCLFVPCITKIVLGHGETSSHIISCLKY